jgi:hypothetical protein
MKSPACSLLIVLTLMASSAAAFPQVVARPPAEPVKLQFVLSKDEGGRKATFPYTLSAVSTGVPVSMRFGVEAPIITTLPGGQTRTTIEQLGTQIDATVRPANDGRFELRFTVNAKPLLPGGRIAQFTLAKTITLRDGETIESTVTDGGETLTIAVTLTAMK